MPEQLQDKKVFTLAEVSQSVQRTLADRYTSAFWVKAEMNKLNYYQYSGHCYPELVEKQGDKVIAQMRSVLWKDTYEQVNRRFLELLKEPLKDGIKILFQARIEFSAVYGLTLRITDIDPSYSLGDLEREKQETLNRLRSEKLYALNRSLPMPLLPQRIALISVETSKGLADFLKIIDGNPYGYRFFHMLFPSLLQGEKAVPDMIRQLERIRKVAHHFDVVAIVRGGGGDVGLSCYNHYALASAIARFPIPVLTGIGHATNETASEMISAYNAITPTNLADYLLQQFHLFAQPVQRAGDQLTELARRYLQQQEERFESETRLFRAAARNLLQTHRAALQSSRQSLQHSGSKPLQQASTSLRLLQYRLQGATQNFRREEEQSLVQLRQSLARESRLLLQQCSQQLQAADRDISNMSPMRVLQRGYSITLLNGKAIQDSSDLNPGDQISTILAQGEVYSTVNKTKNSSDHE